MGCHCGSQCGVCKLVKGRDVDTYGSPLTESPNRDPKSIAVGDPVMSPTSASRGNVSTRHRSQATEHGEHA